MAFTKTLTMVRSNASTAFFKPDDAVIIHNRTVYTNGPVAKLLGMSSEISPDRLTLVVKNTFVSEAAYNEWAADSVNVNNRTTLNAYNAANGITMTEA
jgi:hypothetical protein